MILTLLLTLSALAADLNRECTPTDAGLQRFFSEYVEAHSKADKKALKKLITPSFWEDFREYAPTKPGKRPTFKLLRTQPKGEFCHVEWATTEPGKQQEAPAWVRLELGEGWKIDGIARDLED